MQLVVPPISAKNHYQFATYSMGPPKVSHLCFILMQQYLFMLISHMTNDDQTHF